MVIDLQERNWQNFCAKHLYDWQGICSKYSPQGEMFEYFESLRSFRANQEQNLVTQNNEYKYADGRVVKKTWQINKLTDNLADGVCHSAIPSMRALFFDEGAAVWVMKQLEPVSNLMVELVFESEKSRSSITTHYDGTRSLIRTVCIREDTTGSVSKYLSTALELSSEQDFSGNWQGTLTAIAPDLQVSCSISTHLQFPFVGNKNFYFPGAASVSCPQQISIGKKFSIIANWFVTPYQLQQLTVYYDEFGAFSLVTLESFQLLDNIN